MKKISSYGPVYIVVAILAVFLFVQVLPASAFGAEWATLQSDLWAYLPWLVVFSASFSTLIILLGRR